MNKNKILSGRGKNLTGGGKWGRGGGGSGVKGEGNGDWVPPCPPPHPWSASPLTFSCIICLRFNMLCSLSFMGGSKGGGGGQGVWTPPPEKSQKYRVSKQYWSGSPVKPQSLQANIHSWATIGPPVKRHLIGVSLAGRWWPTYSGIWIPLP